MLSTRDLAMAVERELQRRDESLYHASIRAGLSHSYLSVNFGRWYKGKGGTTLDCMNKVLDAFGLELMIVRKGEGGHDRQHHPG